jgi:hypothetical protein
MHTLGGGGGGQKGAEHGHEQQRTRPKGGPGPVHHLQDPDSRPVPQQYSLSRLQSGM